MPDGLCECGCGGATAMRKGKRCRYLKGHNLLRGTLEERFAAKVAPAADLSPNGMAGCLLWIGCRHPRGYGHFKADAKVVAAHIMAWRLAGRSVQVGHELDHLCRRTSCVNVEHLEPVTHRENIVRGHEARRAAA